MKLFLTFVMLSACFADGSKIRKRSGLLEKTSPSFEIDDLDKDDSHRNLAVTSDFVPLTCNSVMASCKGWTATFGTSNLYTSRVTIPCGACVTMDLVGGKLKLQGGLDIRGKLVFPDGYNITLESTMISVQGELQITSSKPVNGVPGITFYMVGDNNQTFTPYADNQKACGGADCSIGKKAIAVAGGKVTFNGLPANTPTWTRLFDVGGSDPNNPSIIVVPDNVKGKWTKGADIVITSHSVNWYDQQPRTIVDVTASTMTGYVNLVLNATIIRPVTQKESPDFAAEVALLSRNILFLGGPDNTTFHGGHFWIMHTPRVVQTIQGVEFRNFGQQGTLGRYPLHFHMSGDVTGSIFAKNTIRKSNQRCVVIHATNNLLVQENVAFDTKGHCFMLEDGIETGNQFIRNLGALTAKPSRIIPNMGTNGVETDQTLPSTFWITNPTNTFVGNVAAGCEGSGFWFELRKRGERAYLYPDLEPKKESLTLFSGNVAHSNKMRGFRTYPTGYIPDSAASFIGLSAYKNGITGFFIHNSYNIKVIGGVFADNINLGIDIDKAESITIKGARIIGQSPQFTKLMQTQKAKPLCVNNTVIGIESHTWKSPQSTSGVFIDGVQFSGFKNATCNSSIAFRFDQSDKLDMFELPITFNNTMLEQGTEVADFCWTKASGVTDPFVVDLTGTMNPSGVSTWLPGTLMGNNLQMLHFTDSSKCTQVASRCYTYCRNTCLRAARIEIESSGTEGYALRVCRKNDSTDCVVFPSYYWPGNDIDIDTGRSTESRLFSANLPSGQYVATVLNASGTPVWPTYARLILNETYCADSIKESDITITKPTATLNVETSCANLIRNGGAEASRSDPLYWHHRWGGIAVVPGVGVGGSNAIANVRDENGGDDSVGQFLDTSCLAATAGRYYEFTARVKLIKKSTGSIYKCDQLKEACPNVGLITASGIRGQLGSFVDEYNQGDFQLIHGMLFVDNVLASADSVFLYIEKGRTDIDLYVDDMSLKLMPINSPSSSQCANVAYNSNFETKDDRFWSNDGAKSAQIVGVDGSTANFALRMVGGGMRPQLKLGCLTQGTIYNVSVQYQIRTSTGTLFTCDPSSSDLMKQCPEVRLASYQQGVLTDFLKVAFFSSGNPASSGDWSLLTGSFVATSTMAGADDLKLKIMNLVDTRSFIVRDLSIKVKSLLMSDVANIDSCDSNLILNSNMEAGPTGYWMPLDGGVFGSAKGVESSKALRYSDRTGYSDGPAYRAQELMDLTCLRPGAKYEFNADIKLVSTVDGSAVSCKPDFNCPRIRVALRDTSNNMILQYRVRGYDLPSGAWEPGQFNHFRQSFTMPSRSAWDGTVKSWKIEVLDFPQEWDIIIDNFTMWRTN